MVAICTIPATITICKNNVIKFEIGECFVFDLICKISNFYNQEKASPPFSSRLLILIEDCFVDCIIRLYSFLYELHRLKAAAFFVMRLRQRI